MDVPILVDPKAAFQQGTGAGVGKAVFSGVSWLSMISGWFSDLLSINVLAPALFPLLPLSVLLIGVGDCLCSVGAVFIRFIVRTKPKSVLLS